MTIQDVAKHLNVGWDLIKDIVKRDLSRRFAKPKLKHLKFIAIDEISVGKQSSNVCPFASCVAALWVDESLRGGITTPRPSVDDSAATAGS